MKLHLYLSLLVGVNIINVTNSITSTPSTTPVITCRGIYFSDVLDVCQQGLFFISPEISATVDDPTPILYSELKTFTIIPGNLSCNYVVQWKTPQGTFDELDGNVEPGINEICAINEIYTACGYIFLISTTTETTKTTTVYTTSLTSTTTIPSTELSTSTSTLTSTDPTTTQALSTTPILSSTELASSVATPSLSSTVPDSSSTFQPALESSSITSTPSTTSIPSSILSTSSTSSSITPSSSMETSTATLTTFTPSTSADTTTVFSEPTTAEASTATDSTTTMSKTLITSISSSTSLSTPIATSTYTSSVVSSTPSSSMTSFFSTSSFTRSTPTYSSQSTSESATPTSSVMSSSSTPYISTSSSQKEESSTVVPTESTVVSSSSAFSTTITTLTSTQPTSTIVSSSTTMSATPHIETSSSTAATNLNSTSVASTILKSSLATVAISPTEEVMETTPTPVFSTTSVLMTSPSSTSSSTVLSTVNDLDTSDTSLYTTSFSLSTLSSFQLTDSTSDLSTTEKANPTSTLSASSIELSSPTSTSPAHSYSSSDLGSTYHTVTDVTDASEPNLTSASDAPTTTRYIEDLEERKKNELIAEKLEELKSKNETSDDSIDKLLGKNREELIDLIQNEISTNPKMDDESIREYIENITKNMTSANEELAKAIESILGDVDKVDIKSPNVMFDLLENVKGSIAESNGFTIDPTQKTGEQYGTYFSEYGELRGEGFNIVLHGCSVTVQGKDVFLSGKIIPSKIQSANEETYLKYYSEGTVEMVGEFQNWTSVSVNRGSFVSKKLTDSMSVIHFQNTANIQISSNDYNPPMLYGLELWNSSLLRVSGSKQAQNYASLTAFVNIENLQLNLQLTKSLISDLLQGVPQPAISCSFQMTVQDRTYTINTGEGYIMAKSIDETSHTILYIGNSMTVTPEFTELHKLLYFPLNFKNVDVSWFDNTEIGNTTVRLKAANDDILNIDVILPESKLPPVQSRTNPINRTTLIINSPATIDDINVVLKNGGILTVAGAITIENTVIEVGNNSLKVDGKSFTISLGEINTLSLSEVVYELRRTTSPPTLVLLSGRVTATEIPHYRSEFTFDGEDRMYFTGGTLIRNQTNGIILIGSTLQLSKDFSASSFSVIPQSLFTQKSYEYLTNTMSNINDYLSNNSYSLSPEELTKTLDEMLNTTASLIDSLQTTAKSPLPSDVAINLLYEKTNYNDIFNVIPENPDDIRYVEEMTEEEWAAEATEIVQKQMAKDLLEQTKKILTNLVDTIATKKIQNGEIPFLMEFPGAGLEMIIAGGTSEFVLSNTYSCTNWEVGFPKNAEDLNLVGITKDTIIRVDVACYGSNNYYFVDDYNQLINSGSVDVQLKTADSEVIKVKDAKEPIVIMGETLNDNINPSIPLASNPIDENQILDFRSFIVSAWNTSLTIEVQFPTLANGEEKVLFIGYQSQPGPRDEDHEYIFNYNSSIDNNRFFIPSEKLHNMTGMYILGIGTKVSSITNGTVTYDETDKPPEISEPFQFKKDSSEFYARVLTKGCYAYKNETDRMESEGVSVVDSSSTTRVICHSRHLTSFSVGIKNPEIAVKYSYDFTVDIVPKNVRPIILIAAYTIFLLITFYNCCTIERLDKDRGEMRHLKDNHPADEYIYVISVFTGFRQFSSSQSTICFNITGEAASEMGRRLETEEDDVQHVLKWGTCARFLMRTHWPLGNLKYLRLWIEKPGEEQSEAWFCTKVVIYDLQTTKKFTFPVHSWFGRTNGDGQTERLCQVDNSINLFNESISFHNILEQISYIAMFLGGTGISRLRLERDVYILSLWISSSIITTILCFTTHLLNNSKTKDSYKIFDAVVGMILALLLTVINMILPYIAKKSYTRDENERVKYYKQNYTNYVEAKRQWKPLFKTLVTTIVKTTIMILLVLNTVKCFSLSEQYANIFTRRFLVMMFLWLALFEPFKAFLMCLKNIKWNRTYQIISPSELSFLPIKALAEFQKCPEEIVDKSTGSSYADLSKLRASKDNRMRDEMLFHTVREIIFLVFSLIIFVSLTYLLRDRFGYYYHHQIKNNYNLETKESSFSNIKSIDDFWKWSDSSLVNGLMASWPDGEPAYDMRGFVNDKASRTMGTGIIRQIRSIPHKCDFVLPEASSQSVCVNDIWNAGYEMTSHFDASWLPYTNSTDIEYTYRSSELLQSNSIMGQLGTYKGGGYVVSLQGTADALRTKFQKLRNESWIDKETRAVVVELSLYNAQINYFGVLQLLLEIPRAKFCLPTVWVESMRLIREDEDTINGTIECLYICYCVIKFTLEFFYIIHDRFKLLGKHLIFSPIQLLRWLMIGGYDLWQTMDFFVGLVSMISIITYIMKVVYVKEAVDSFLNTNGNSYINLSKQRDTDLMFTYTFATVVFFVSCKLMKILRFNHRIGVLADTLESATTGITDYGQGFLCVLNAFILAMMHLLGNSLEGYYSYIVSLQTLVSSLLGKLGGGKVYDLSTLGSTYFLLFMFLGTVLLLNVFVMIIMYEFEIVRTNADRLANNYEIIEHISYKVKNTCGMLERSNKVSVALQDQYCEAPFLQIFKRKIYLAIYRMSRLHNMNRLNRTITREARIESVPDDIKNATVL